MKNMQKSNKIIIPGVGNFKYAMNNLVKFNLIDVFVRGFGFGEIVNGLIFFGILRILILDWFE